jgi:hypothetical protein
MECVLLGGAMHSLLGVRLVSHHTVAVFELILTRYTILVLLLESTTFQDLVSMTETLCEIHD